MPHIQVIIRLPYLCRLLRILAIMIALTYFCERQTDASGFASDDGYITIVPEDEPTEENKIDPSRIENWDSMIQTFPFTSNRQYPIKPVPDNQLPTYPPKPLPHQQTAQGVPIQQQYHPNLQIPAQHVQSTHHNEVAQPHQSIHQPMVPDTSAQQHSQYDQPVAAPTYTSQLLQLIINMMNQERFTFIVRATRLDNHQFTILNREFLAVVWSVVSKSFLVTSHVTTELEELTKDKILVQLSISYSYTINIEKYKAVNGDYSFEGHIFYLIDDLKVPLPIEGITNKKTVEDEASLLWKLILCLIQQQKFNLMVKRVAEIEDKERYWSFSIKNNGRLTIAWNCLLGYTRSTRTLYERLTSLDGSVFKSKLLNGGGRHPIRYFNLENIDVMTLRKKDIGSYGYSLRFVQQLCVLCNQSLQSCTLEEDNIENITNVGNRKRTINQSSDVENNMESTANEGKRRRTIYQSSTVA